MELISPGGSIRAGIFVRPDGLLYWQVTAGGKPVIESSRLGITIDGVDLGQGARIQSVDRETIDRTYAYRGGKSTAVDRANLARLHLLSGATSWIVEARAGEDGFAFRYRVEGDGRLPRRVNGEETQFRLPAATRVWFAERNNAWKLKSGSGEWISADIDRMPTVSSQGPVQAAPLVLELPQGGYALLSEAAAFNYSGLRYRAIGGRAFAADFGEGAAGFSPGNRIVTPWRAVLCAADLNGLVNDTLIDNLAPPPDPALFSDQSYIRPGRAVWRWQIRKTGTVSNQKAYVDFAVQLGYEYSLVDEGWEVTWPDPLAGLADLCRYAKNAGVGVLVWKRWPELSDPAGDYAALRRWLDGVKRAGVVGVKVDFFNSEDFLTQRGQERVLREAAKRRLMATLHGSNKPTGEAIRYPNEISREAVRGLELNYMKEGPLPPSHDAALPFTRGVVGRADYTPLTFQADHMGRTTLAHQLATVTNLVSPLLVLNAFPEDMLNANPPEITAYLKAVPSVWDETRVLPGSAIGQLAVLARRHGRAWFVSAVNGGNPRLYSLKLDFLGSGTGAAVLLTDSGTPTTVHARRFAAVGGQSIDCRLDAGGGFVLWVHPD